MTRRLPRPACGICAGGTSPSVERLREAAEAGTAFVQPEEVGLAAFLALHRMLWAFHNPGVVVQLEDMVAVGEELAAALDKAMPHEKYGDDLRAWLNVIEHRSAIGRAAIAGRFVGNAFMHEVAMPGELVAALHGSPVQDGRVWLGDDESPLPWLRANVAGFFDDHDADGKLVMGVRPVNAEQPSAEAPAAPAPSETRKWVGP